MSSGISADVPRESSRLGGTAWLLPREHGAYVQLVFPLITALALGGASAAQIAWALAGMCVFLAHESILVLLGQRGRRMTVERGLQARNTALALLTLALAGGLIGWRWAPEAARAALVFPAVPAAALVPVARAGGVAMGAAVAAAVVWGAVFALLTLSVRLIIATGKRRAEVRRAALVNFVLALAAILAAFLATGAGLVPALAAAAVLPAALVSAALAIVPVSPRHLREVGWFLAVTNVLTVAALVFALR